MTGAKSGPVDYEISSGVASIKLTSPQSGNVLNGQMLQELLQALTQATTEESCRVITLSALGPDFCAGLDITALLDSDCRPNLRFYRMFQECLRLITTSNCPIVACVEGSVQGGGVGLVAACDIVLASKNSAFMLPEVIIGIIPALVTIPLMRRLTLAQIKYIALSSRSILATDAKQIGLVDELAESAVSPLLDKQLARLLRSSPLALAESKRYLNSLDSKTWDQLQEAALTELLTWLERPEVIDGLRTYAEGFVPSWFQRYKGKKHD